MRALTLHRPWDWAMARGGKDIENRKWEPWPAIIGQRIALHAGKTYDYEGAEFIRERLGPLVTPMPQTQAGVIVAVTTVVGWVRVEDGCTKVVETSELTPAQLARAMVSPWLSGPYGWVVEGTVALPMPVPCRGAQGLWTLPREVERAVVEQLEKKEKPGP